MPYDRNEFGAIYFAIKSVPQKYILIFAFLENNNVDNNLVIFKTPALAISAVGDKSM